MRLDDVLPTPVSVQAAPAVRWRPGRHLRVIVPARAAAPGHHLAELLAPLLGAPPPVRMGVAGPGDVVLRLDGVGEGESYTVDIGDETVMLSAPGEAGLFHAVQTLRQLLPANRSTVDLELRGARIVDHPRYAYRGVMLDVARHFFDVAAVKRLIELAALYKLNHLHLHLTDDQGWRIAIRSWPRLASVGGATEVGDGAGGYYTPEQYQEIVAYAGAHHITVVPEIGLPGHSNAALYAYPELAADGVVPIAYTGIEVGFSSLTDRPATYRFLDDVFGELAALTPGPYLHIGGDEALSTSRHDYATIVSRAQQIVAAHGKVPIGWHEIAGTELGSSTVVQFWGVNAEAPDVLAAAKQGNRLIMSPANRTYLDMKYEPASPLGLMWAGAIGIRDSYDWDPATYLPGLPDAAVLGVESPLWSETLRSVADLEFMAFPRLAATAELAWSASAHDWVAFRRRLAAQAPHWTALGINYHRSPEVDWSRPDVGDR